MFVFSFFFCGPEKFSENKYTLVLEFLKSQKIFDVEFLGQHQEAFEIFICPEKTPDTPINVLDGRSQIEVTDINPWRKKLVRAMRRAWEFISGLVYIWPYIHNEAFGDHRCLLRFRCVYSIQSMCFSVPSWNVFFLFGHT